ncbi:MULTISPECIES: hypothetical protein [unclassified Streptomyces]|uniref:hypothetical protein n=1 Tax=unclassified Streptomyces TaxID=2593676 RepID=UPI0027420E96|nr:MULTISPECIES: hypothetical protein [unclassified Streptomyces]
MKLKRFTQAGLVAATVAVAGLGLALPAAASGSVSCDGYRCTASAGAESKYYEAQVDNNPGNGAASWIWVYSNSGYQAHADYYLEGDSTMHQYYSPVYGATSMNLGKDVTAFRVCGWNGAFGDTCTSTWAHPQY